MNVVGITSDSEEVVNEFVERNNLNVSVCDTQHRGSVCDIALTSI